MIVVIPCYEPDARLLALVDALLAPGAGLRIVVVDDGSGPGYTGLFEAARRRGCDLVAYPQNRGKGHALKRGLALAAERYPGEDVVCADCDGQHTPADIRRVAAALRLHPGSIVLGSRRFAGDGVPARNRYGNTVTRFVFDRVTGQRLQDTQTGLRAYPATMLPWLRGIAGQRYEYELHLLLAARKERVPVVEVPIATVYLNGNRSSHQRLPWDPIRIYAQFLRFGVSSLTAFAIDATLFFLFVKLTGNLAFSVVGARAASASANYAINERLVFLGAGRRSGARYAGLALVLVAANYTLMRMLTAVAAPLLVAKVVTESTLFAASYKAQRRYVFAPERGDPAKVPAEDVGARA